MKLNCNSFFDGEFKEITLNEFLETRHIHDTKNPELVQIELDKLGYNTFGGYGENRKEIFRGSYLELSGNYTHLGIDINVKKGTKVICPFDCEVVDVFIDTDVDIGWGGRVILRQSKALPYLVLGHFEPNSIINSPKSFFKKGEILGEVGTWPTNGNVFEHLHVQCVYYLLKTNLDGYGKPSDLLNNPNPFEVEFLSTKINKRLMQDIGESKEDEA